MDGLYHADESLMGDDQATPKSAINHMDIQSDWFWYFWAKAGGNIEEYICNNMPTHALTAALMLTISLEGLRAPPATLVDNVVENSTSPDFEFDTSGPLLAYNILMMVSTVTNIALLFLASQFLEHFNSCSNFESKLNFCAKFGWLVALAYGLLNIGFVALMVAIFVQIYHESGSESAWPCVGLFVFTYALIWFCLYRIPIWNHENYIPSVKVAAAKLAQPPKLQLLMQGALDHADDVPKVMKLLEKQRCRDVRDLIQYMEHNARAEQHTPGTGRFSQCLQELGIDAFDALRIGLALEPYIVEKLWTAQAGGTNMDRYGKKKAKKAVGKLGSGLVNGELAFGEEYGFNHTAENSRNRNV